MRWKALLFLIVPGLCQVHHEHATRGVVWFLAFVLAFNLFLVAPYVAAAGWIRILGLLVAAVVWFLAAIDGAKCAARTAAEPENRRETISTRSVK